MKKILISGASGFMGQALTKHHKKNTVVPVKRDLLNNPIELEEFMKKEKPDIIYHCAAYGNRSDQQDMDEIVTTNIIKTFFMLRASREIDYEAFINIGSSSEYGRKDHPMSETNVPEPDTFYASSKVGATYLARAFAIQYDKPIITARPFSLYGPNDHESHFIPTVIRHLDTEEPMDLVPHPMHDWIYIDDFIEALDVIIEKATNLKGNIVNIGTGVQYSNNEVVEKLEKLSNKEVSVNIKKSLRPFDNASWVADNSFIKNLGWSPAHTLYDGLKKTYEQTRKKNT